MTRAMRFCRIDGNGRQTAEVLRGPTYLSADGPRRATRTDTAEVDAGEVLLVPVASNRHALTALIVPDGCSAIVSINRQPLARGLHEVGHGDRLDVGTLTAFLAEDQQAEVVAYDPALHGEDQRCARTKTRLKSGDRIVRCPGCNTVYSERAWGLERPCEICRHDPTARPWEPPPEQHGRCGLNELLDLAQNQNATS